MVRTLPLVRQFLEECRVVLRNVRSELLVPGGEDLKAGDGRIRGTLSATSIRSGLLATDDVELPRAVDWMGENRGDGH